MMEFHSRHQPLTFTGDPVHVAQLVTAATVTLIGSVNVGALLTAGVAVALVEVCGVNERSVNEVSECEVIIGCSCTVTVPAVVGQLEARGAAALVGAQEVFTLVRT